jgi:hypothetical protein
MIKENLSLMSAVPESGTSPVFCAADSGKFRDDKQKAC